MGFSLIMALICMKICIHDGEICFEGSVSQHFDIGISFCFMVCRIRIQKITKVALFVIKQKLGPKQRI